MTYLVGLGLGSTWGNDVLKYQLLQLIKTDTNLVLPSDYSILEPLAKIVSNLELPEELKRKNITKVKTETFVDSNIELNIVFDDKGTGSNAWVISGNHTKSGKPILSSDPHLTATIPSCWYLAKLYVKDVEIIAGFSIGVLTPGALKTKSISLAPTAVKTDNIDVYIEKIVGNKYLYDEKYLELEEFEEKIEVKGQGTKVYKFKETIHGPVLSNNLIGAQSMSFFLSENIDVSLSFAWSVYDFNCRMAEILPELLTAKSVDDIRKAFSLVTSINLGVAIATADGDIGFQSTGRVPIRNSLGDLPLPGWVKNNTWSGYIPFEELPYVVNPSKGFIVLANNAPVDENYKHYDSIGRYFSPGRADRITELIQEKIDKGVKITSKDCLDIQKDELSVFARSAVPNLLKKLKTLSDYTTELKLMKEWNFILSKDSKAAALYVN